jgi:ribonucleoside-diphosphate reductase alpha chain
MEIKKAARERLESVRDGKTRRFKLKYLDEVTGDPRELKFYVVANYYLDGRLAEVFIRGDKIGGFLGGALDMWAIMFSLAMQHGISMRTVMDKMRNQRFGPGAYAVGTGDPEFPSCSSMFDLIAQWLEKQFPDGCLAPTGRVPP